jgi:hypothetical protein
VVISYPKFVSELAVEKSILGRIFEVLDISGRKVRDDKLFDESMRNVRLE